MQKIYLISIMKFSVLGRLSYAQILFEGKFYYCQLCIWHTIIFIIILIAVVITTSYLSSSSSSSSTPESGDEVQLSLPLTWYICRASNSLRKTIELRLNFRHFSLQARWLSVLVRFQSSVSSSRRCSHNWWSWLVLSATQHPELR
jgi:hypothetical protein